MLLCSVRQSRTGSWSCEGAKWDGGGCVKDVGNRVGIVSGEGSVGGHHDERIGIGAVLVSVAESK